MGGSQGIIEVFICLLVLYLIASFEDVSFLGGQVRVIELVEVLCFERKV